MLDIMVIEWYVATWFNCVQLNMVDVTPVKLVTYYLFDIRRAKPSIVNCQRRDKQPTLQLSYLFSLPKMIRRNMKLKRHLHFLHDVSFQYIEQEQSCWKLNALNLVLLKRYLCDFVHL